jgi:hypothetical protein
VTDLDKSRNNKYLRQRSAYRSNIQYITNPALSPPPPHYPSHSPEGKYLNICVKQQVLPQCAHSWRSSGGVTSAPPPTLWRYERCRGRQPHAPARAFHTLGVSPHSSPVGAKMPGGGGYLFHLHSFPSKYSQSTFVSSFQAFQWY